MTEHQAILDIVIPFVWLIIPIIALLSWYKMRTTYKIEQLKEEKKLSKSEETLSGSINKMLNDAPKQLKTINSEIATLEEKCRRENMPDKQKNELLSRLYSERDMLSYGVKYGGVVKPFLKPMDKIVNKFLGGLGGN